MAQINLTLMGKGGVGKSYIASLLAQYNKEQGRNVVCYDTDPVNATLAQFKALSAKRVKLGKTADEVNPRFFDELMGNLLEAGENDVIVIDNGASTFLPLLSYAVENAAMPMLKEAGHEVRIHCVLTGGQALNDTIVGLNQVLKNFDDVSVVVWENEFFGPIQMMNGSGKAISFEDAPIFKNNKERYYALVRLMEQRRETFGFDIGEMLKAHLTFNEAIEDSSRNIMARQRLKQTWAAIRSNMDRANL